MLKSDRFRLHRRPGLSSARSHAPQARRRLGAMPWLTKTREAFGEHRRAKDRQRLREALEPANEDRRNRWRAFWLLAKASPIGEYIALKWRLSDEWDPVAFSPPRPVTADQ